MVLLQVLFFVFAVFVAIKVYVKHTSKQCKSKVSLVGKTTIVTGANTGIGYETALDFAKRGARVILACRSESKANEARDKIIKETENKNVVVRLVDMMSLKSVREFAENITETEDRVDILVNNAGMGSYKNLLSNDGYQMLLQINYLAPFLLTILLLDLLKKSSPSRIVNVSSIAAKYGEIDPKNLNSFPGPWKNYHNTKLLNILFTQRLAKLLQSTNVSVFSLHPGAIKTDIFRAIRGWRKQILNFVMNIYFKTPEEGAQTTLYTSLEQGIERYSGGHFNECQFQEPYPVARNSQLAKEAFEKTIELLNCQDDVKKVLILD